MLDDAALRALEARIRVVEQRTGAQVVVAALERADVYPGLRWRAFGLGCALAGGGAAGVAVARPAWLPASAPLAVLAAVGAVLVAGLTFAVAAVLIPAFARLFLESLRAEAEARQRAERMFLERELFATRARVGVLLLACRFERVAVVLADRGLRARVAQPEWGAVAAASGPHLRSGRVAPALLAGLDALEALLLARGFAGAGGGHNEIADRPLTETGP